MIHHHWVHRRHQKGRCKHCGKSFQSKLSFGSKVSSFRFLVLSIFTIENLVCRTCSIFLFLASLLEKLLLFLEMLFLMSVTRIFRFTQCMPSSFSFSFSFFLFFFFLLPSSFPLSFIQIITKLINASSKLLLPI